MTDKNPYAIPLEELDTRVPLELQVEEHGKAPNPDVFAPIAHRFGDEVDGDE